MIRIPFVVIFKELIYACDNIETTLHIELENPNNNNKKEEENEEKKELNDKIKIILQVYQLKDSQSSEFPLIESKYSHNLRGVLLQTIESINSILIPHITFKGGLLVEDKKKPNQKKNEQIEKTRGDNQMGILTIRQIQCKVTRGYPYGYQFGVPKVKARICRYTTEPK